MRKEERHSIELICTSLTGGIKMLFKANKVTHAEGHGKITGVNEVWLHNKFASFSADLEDTF